jgi:hypothetical protein
MLKIHRAEPDTTNINLTAIESLHPTARRKDRAGGGFFSRSDAAKSVRTLGNSPVGVHADRFPRPERSASPTVCRH